ncbi:MAG: glycosyltransferase family 2 protein [Candidatus Omnitrophota bacterium]
MKLEQLSVFLPAYNEQDNIVNTVEAVYKIMPHFAEKFEVIIINDGSSDQTAARLEELANKYVDFRIITHANNRGYGAALKSGFLNSKYDYIFFSDSDGQFDLSQIDKLITLINICDIAIGFRIKRQDPLYRIINAKAYNLLVVMLFGLGVRDIDCAFKLIRKNVLDKINLKSESQFISAEFLIKAKKLGFRIQQCPVKHLPRTEGRATGNSFRAIVNSFKELFRLWKELKH